jgi:hypothetical protein
MPAPGPLLLGGVIGIGYAQRHCLDDVLRSAREAFRRHPMSFTPLREFREIAPQYLPFPCTARLLTTQRHH